jgi:hypothetical protein
MARSIATNKTVDLAELLDFVRPRHRLLLATTRRDGRPQISPVTGGVDFQGRIVHISGPIEDPQRREGPTGLSARPLRRLERPVGTGRRRRRGAAHAGRSRRPRRLFPLHLRRANPDWEEYREAMRIQDKSLIRITPTRWGPIATGGFPADVAERLDELL